MLRKFIFHPGLVTDGWVSIDQVNGEIIRGLYKKSIREERLMLAVLENAVEYFQKYVLARNPRGKQLFQEVEEWFPRRLTPLKTSARPWGCTPTAYERACSSEGSEDQARFR
jgi:hypothetical protein